MTKLIRNFSACALITCFLLATVARFPLNLHPLFIDIVRSDFFVIFTWITPFLFTFFLLIFFFSLMNLPYFKTSKLKRLLPICISAILIVAYNLLSNFWEDKVIMSWLWKKDLDALVELVQQKKIKIIGKYNDSDTAILPKNLRYLTTKPGFVAINLYKTHENETTISFLNMVNFMSSYSFYYSSLDLPPTPKNEPRTFGKTVVSTVRKIMPHWYVIYEMYDD